MTVMMPGGHAGRRYAVIDIETGPNVDAMLCAEPRPRAEMDLSALHKVRAAVVLGFAVAAGAPTSLRFDRLGGDVREQELLASLDRLLPSPDAGGCLISFNGRAWDVPMLLQRAAASWCFGVPRLAAFSAAQPDHHIDMMRRGGARSGRGWSSLADRAAALGIDMRLARGRQARTEAAVRRRCTADVAVTFLLFAASEAVLRSDARFFARGWLALAAAIRSDPALFRDLRYLAEHPVIDGCRALAGGAAVYTPVDPQLANDVA